MGMARRCSSSPLKKRREVEEEKGPLYILLGRNKIEEKETILFIWDGSRILRVLVFVVLHFSGFGLAGATLQWDEICPNGDTCDLKQTGVGRTRKYKGEKRGRFCFCNWRYGGACIAARYWLLAVTGSAGDWRYGLAANLKKGLWFVLQR